jgi:hypothetical protein
MRKEIEEWNEWLRVNKNIEINQYLDEYLNDRHKTITEFLQYVSNLTQISLYKLYYKGTTKKSRGGSNKISMIRGMIVKAVLLNANIKRYALKDIYFRIFNVHKDHATALYWREQIFTGDDLKLYEDIENYLKTYQLIWD